MSKNLQLQVKHLRDKIKRIAGELQVEPRHTARAHFYYVPALNETFPSVSAEHRNIKDPSIRNFEKNEALRYIRDNLPILIEASAKMNMDVMDAVFKQASEAAVKERDNSGTIGSYIHSAREHYFRVWIDSDKTERPPANIEAIAKSWKADIPPEFYHSVLSGCAAMDKFVSETGYIPLGCELYVYDAKRKVAGTLDDVGLMPVKGEYTLVILDLKSSNQFKIFYTLQVCRYQNMFKKLFHLIPKKILIVKVSKEDRTYSLEWFKPEQILNGHKANHYLSLFNKHFENIEEIRKKEYKVI